MPSVSPYYQDESVRLYFGDWAELIDEDLVADVIVTDPPYQLLEPLITYSCQSGGTVLDLFAGAGSTGVAAKLAGRKAVLFELREEQCEKAARRLAQDVLDLGTGTA